jgi:hypothetical protein
MPLEKVLNPDGTFDLSKGFNGSVDPRGWRMVKGKNGEPRFVSDKSASSISVSQQSGSAVGDENWDNQFAFPGPGVDGDVFAIAVSGSDVYVGGWFAPSGGVAAKNIAKWDGSAWSSLGSGVNSDVRAIAVSGSDVYVGGWFTQAGGVDANHIAKWNGSAWSSLGSGVNDCVRAIAVSGSDVYVGGYFTQAGGAAVNNIAKWNGNAWSSLGSGVNDDVNAIAVSGSDVYVGGWFTQAGGVDANHIAKWNGSAWSSLGSGVSNGVTAISVSGSDVYVGGWFTQAGGITTNSIAKWNGSVWSSLGSGVNFGGIDAIAVSGSNVYVGGLFTQAGGVAVNNIAKWDGSAWSSLGSGVNSDVRAIALSGSEVYVGGWFTQAGGVAVNYISKWNGGNWSSLGSVYLGSGVNDDVRAITMSGSDVYVGGYFTQAGGVAANRIAKWNGNAWSLLGSGVNFGSINAIAVSGSNVYVGGYFTQAGGVAVNNIAIWNGSTWSSLGSGVSSGVAAISVSGSDVYVGGWFTQAGGVAVNNIAKWNGSAWSSLGSGVNDAVNSIAVSGSDVYVGGWFTQAGGVAANRIAKWNGSAWSSLGSGVNWYVYNIAMSGSDVYVGGEFHRAGEKSSSYIAFWHENNQLDIQFSRITTGDIVNNVGLSRGASWGDYDNDGYQDLHVSNSGTNANFLYKNNGNGTFTRITTGSIVTDKYSSRGASWGDYDNDGDLDLFVANYDGANNCLYRNNGGGTFTKITTGNIVSDGGDSMTGNWGDYDNDGYADLFVCNYNGQNNWLYHNNGDGTFTKVASGVIVNDGGSSICASWVDYDNDHDLDLFVCNYFGENNYLYNNNGNGTFTKVTTGDIVNDGGYSNSCEWADYDNDGDPDLYVTNRHNERNFLYQNNGNGTFTKITTGVIVEDAGDWPGSTWGDFNNDGYLDLFVTQYGNNNALYINNDDATFRKMTAGHIVNDGENSYGPASADYDNDGDLDIFVANYNANNFLYENNGNGNNWINILCIGTVSNKTAFGTKIRVKASLSSTSQTESIWQMRGIDAQTAYSSQSSLNAEFGLGEAVKVDSIVIEWPSGIVQVLTNISVNQFLTVVEGQLYPNMIYTFPQAGWYMVSLPVIPADSSVATLFPAALGGMAFGWDPDVGSYVPETKMKPKKGYWIAIPGATTATVTGLPLYSYTDHYAVQGWYMIGSVLGTVNFTDPNDNPAGSVLSPAFGWNSSAGSYEPATTLNEKEGYWAAMFNACDLTVGGAGGGASAPIAKADWEAFYQKYGKTPPSPPTLDGKTSKAIETPKEFGLFQNYPNPFNPETKIRYQIPDARFVRLTVYNTMGQAVRILVDGHQNPGSYEVVWDGKDEDGMNIGSGMYLVRMEAGKFVSMRKVLLMK